MPKRAEHRAFAVDPLVTVLADEEIVRTGGDQSAQ